MAQIVNPEELTKFFLNEIKLGKLVPTVKGTVWLCLGVIMRQFSESIDPNLKTEIQNISFRALREQMSSKQKPELTAIARIMKSFKYSLVEDHLLPDQKTELFQLIMAGIVPIKDVHGYQIINCMQALGRRDPVL